MKKLLVMFLMLSGLASFAVEPEVYVVPLNPANSNSYGFEPVSQIVARDISKGLGTLKLNDFSSQEILQKYNKTGVIDFEKLNIVTGKTLLVIAYVEDNNFTKLDLWDTLKLSSDFGLDFPFTWTTKVILVDNNDGVALWQKTYTCPLTSKNSSFVAADYTKAVEQYEKIHSYSKNVIAKDVEENVKLRLHPKAIDYASKVKNAPENNEGIGLKYYKKRGVPVKITQPSETFEQQLLKDDSFSL